MSPSHRTLWSVLAGAFGFGPLRVQEHIEEVITQVKPPGPSIQSIIQIAYPSVLNELRKGRAWVTDDLNTHLNITLVNEMPPFELVAYTPISWTEEDDLKNPRDHQRISLVANLIRNGILSHEDQILHKLQAYQLLVHSKNREVLGVTHHLKNHYLLNIYTAYAAMR